MNLILAIVALFCLAVAAPVSADKRGAVSGKKRSSHVQPDDESGEAMAMMMKKTAVW